MFDVQTLVEAFVNMPLRSAWIIKEAFSFLVKSQMLVLGLV
jgi:hypothetical protein